MTAFSRALILAGLVAVTGASGALADGKSRDAARAPEPVITQNAPVLQQGRSAAVEEGYLKKQEDKNFLTDRRSSDDNN